MLSIIAIFTLFGCGKKEKREIEILIPAGSTEAFVYSDEEIRPTGNKITIWSVAGLSDTEVILKPVEVKQENSYEPIYLTHGMPVKMDVEKGGWFKIGVSVQNDSDRGPIAVSVEVEGVEVRSVEKIEDDSSEETIVGGDLVPMVMVNGKLYFDTGTESTVEARCGMMDGEISSSVARSEKPTKDNESNFGTGYGYQYGETERTIEIYLNEKWWIFATEEVRQQIQLPSVEVCGYSTEQNLEIIENDELTDIEAFLAKNLITEEEMVLTADEGQLIVDIMESINWVEGAPACDNDYIITVINDTYYYHSDCGTFFDIVNNKSKSLSEEEKERVNNYIKR